MVRGLQRDPHGGANDQGRHPVIDIRHADWRSMDVMVDATITDPPYGGTTHKGHDAGGPQITPTRRAITYDPWTPEEVQAFVRYWAPRTAGWMACFCSHDLIEPYQDAYRSCGRYAFSPVSVIQKRPRLLGDGPASWTIYLMVSRPASRAWQKWRCLPGSYAAKLERGAPIVGAKPLSLMRDIVRDYSSPGDLVCDPCAGWGSTLIAAHELGRKAIGCDANATIVAAAATRISEYIW